MVFPRTGDVRSRGQRLEFFLRKFGLRDGEKVPVDFRLPAEVFISKDSGRRSGSLGKKERGGGQEHSGAKKEQFSKQHSVAPRELTAQMWKTTAYSKAGAGEARLLIRLCGIHLGPWLRDRLCDELLRAMRAALGRNRDIAKGTPGRALSAARASVSGRTSPAAC